LFELSIANGKRGAADAARAAQVLALARLDLDHARARHRHQERRVRAVVDLAQVDDGHGSSG
jgi:hypothetical protein